MHFGIAILLLFFVDFTITLYEEEVGVIDWHFRSIGRIRNLLLFPDKSIIAVGDYLAAINPSSGALIWRSKATRNCSAIISDINQGNLLAIVPPSPLQQQKILLLQGKDGKIINQISGSVEPPIIGASLADGSLVLQTETFIEYYNEKGEKLWHKKGSFEILGFSNDERDILVSTGRDIVKVNVLTGKDGSSISVNGKGYYFDTKLALVISNDGLFTFDVLSETEKSTFAKESAIQKILYFDGFNYVIVVSGANAGKETLVKSSLFNPVSISEKEIMLDATCNSNGSCILMSRGNNETLIFREFLQGRIDEKTLSISMDASILFSDVSHHLVAFDKNTLTLAKFKSSPSNFVLEWEREEALSNIVSSTFLELPEAFLFSEIKGEIEREENSKNVLSRFLYRLKAHLDQLWLSTLNLKNALGSNPIDHGSLVRDKAGLKKLLIFLTGDGQVFAWNTLSRKKVWKLQLPQTQTYKQQKIYVTKLSHPSVLTVVSGKKLVEIDGLSGKILNVKESECERPIYQKDGGNLICPSQTKSHVDNHYYYYYYEKVQGEKLEGKTLVNNEIVWKFSLPGGESMSHSVYESDKSGIASAGRVLGNRTVFYKYLNPNLIGFFGYQVDKGIGCSVYILDGTSGNLLYHGTLAWAKLNSATMAISENSILLSYWNVDQKRTEMTIIELYERDKVDLKSDNHLLAIPPFAMEDTFAYGSRITALGVTSSLFGISWKQYFAITETGFIQMFRRRITDVRRPRLKKLSPDDQEELLIPYEPVVRIDSKSFVSHSLSLIFNSNPSIQISHTLMESTSYVLVTGFDIYLSRVTPSGTFDQLNPDFDKFMLTAATFGLWIAILFIKNMLSRKQLISFWSQ